MSRLPDAHFDELVSVLTNALQVALLLSSRLEPALRQASRESGELLTAVERAVSTARQIRLENGGQR